MTTTEIEKELDQWKVIVHGNQEFTPNCLCKFIWETPKGEDVWIFINTAESLRDLVRTIKMQMFVHKVKESPKSDLVINY